MPSYSLEEQKVGISHICYHHTQRKQQLSLAVGSLIQAQYLARRQQSRNMWKKVQLQSRGGKENTISRPDLLDTTYDEKAWANMPTVSEMQRDSRGLNVQKELPRAPK